MKPKNHTTLSATAAIAAALAFTAAPLAAQSTDAPASPAPSMQSQPIEPAPPVVAAPTPTVVVPDVSAAPDASAAQTPDTSTASTPAATGASDTVAPVKRTTTHTTVTRTTTVSHTAPAAAAPVAAVPAPANDVAPAPAAAPVDNGPIAAPPPLPASQPTAAQTNDVIGTLGVVLLALLALAILAAGLLFFRRRHPAVVETETRAEPVAPRRVEEPVAPPVAEAPIAQPAAEAAATVPMAAPTMLRRRDPNPMRGALPSNGASVDLPARLPDSFEERAALLDRMVEAKPDKANPFTDRRARMRRARLIMQSLGTTFDREPWIDFSQYPNNWPELQRQYHKAA